MIPMHIINDEMSKIELLRIAFISRVPVAEVTNARIAFYGAMLRVVPQTIEDPEVLKVVTERLASSYDNAVEILADNFIEYLNK